MLSYWERSSFLQYDYIILGSGITGLSAAASIIEKQANARIVILEKGLFPSGASTKNAGFACVGSLTEKCSDLQRMGEETFIKIIQNRVRGLQILRNRLGDSVIEYRNCGGFELVMDDLSRAAIPQINRMNQLLQPIFGKAIFSEDSQAASRFGMNTSHIETCIRNDFDGDIHTGKMMRALIRYVQERGVQIYTQTSAQTPIETGDGVEVAVIHNTEEIVFKAKKVLVCTNAFTPALFPTADVKPGRGQVVLTHPIPDLKLQGVFYFDDGFYYFRCINNRILFGGGRNLDFEGERTTSMELNSKIHTSLDHYLRNLILPNTAFEIDMRWSGIMGFGDNKTPIVEAISEHIGLGVRLNGMGVALAGSIGEQLAEWAIHDKHLTIEAY